MNFSLKNVIDYALSLMGQKMENAVKPRSSRPKYQYETTDEVAHHRVPSKGSRRRNNGQMLYTVKDVPIIRATLIPRGRIMEEYREIALKEAEMDLASPVALRARLADAERELVSRKPKRERTMSYDPMRRCDLNRMTPAEKAIREAIIAVEALPADERLTNALNHLIVAQLWAADYIDGLDSVVAQNGMVPARPSVVLTNVITPAPTKVTSVITDQMVERAFNRLSQNDGVGWDRSDLRDALKAALATAGSGTVGGEGGWEK